MRSDDEVFVTRCIEGDQAAFDFLVSKYKEVVHAYAYHKVGDYQEAQDIAQEVFIKAYSKLGQLKWPHRFQSWLYTIVSNECKMWLRKRSKEREKEISWEDVSSDELSELADRAHEDEEMKLTVASAMETLPADNQLALSLYYMSDLSIKEIAHFMGISANTVKGKLYRARQQLGERLEKMLGRQLRKEKLRSGFIFAVVDSIRNMPIPSPPEPPPVKWRPISIGTALLIGIIGFGISFGGRISSNIFTPKSVETPFEVYLLRDLGEQAVLDMKDDSEDRFFTLQDIALQRGHEEGNNKESEMESRIEDLRRNRMATMAKGTNDRAEKLQRGEEAFRHGFRQDPMQFLDSDQSLQGAMARTFVFQSPLEGDRQILQKRIDEILAEQLDDGTLSDDEQHRIQFTAEKLIELAELGADPGSPEIKRAIEAILRERSDGDEETLGLYAVRALCMFGITDRPEVLAGLRQLVEDEDEWNGPYKLCPWTPSEHLMTLWVARDLYDVEPLVAKSLSWIADGLNDAGCLSYKDPWGFVKMAGVIDHPLAGKIAEREIQMLLRAQKPDGGWGDQSFHVFRALVKHDLMDRVRALPPLESDWQIVRSIPAPEGDLFTMTWDGQRLWVRDGKTNEAIAVSPQDGKVLRRVKLPVDKVFGIGWWDDALAVTQTEPKRLLQVDPETGEIKQEISLDSIYMVMGVTQVDGKMWIGDGFNCVVSIVDPAHPEDGCDTLVLGGPGPTSLASDGNAVWHFDFWAPAIIKSDLNGQLLDWGEKPFDGSVNGLAWDGEMLWALDNEQKRICAIEKSVHLEELASETP
jgi:RNA polymerase sigma-70 factor (ECF subfamily)